MDGTIKLSATVISCIGNETDRDDFYFNGNFSNCHNTQSIQCSFEKSANNFIFAVSDSMGLENGETGGISAVREIKKYHESAKNNQFILENITERIYEAVQLSSNLIYSQSIIASQNSSILTGFSSLIIDNDRAVLMNLGNNGAFLYRQGQQKEVFSKNGGKKSEKLKMLGITPNTTEFFNDTGKLLKLAEEESKTKIKLSSSFALEEGDLIILCSDGLLNGTNKNRIEAVIDSGLDPSKMASVLFQEAIKNGLSEGITIMVIQVEEIRSTLQVLGQKKLNQMNLYNEPEDEEEEEKSGGNVINYILGFVCVLVISGVLFMGYLIARNSGIFGLGAAENSTAQSSILTDSTSEDTSLDTTAEVTDSEATQSGDSINGDGNTDSNNDSNTDNNTDGNSDNGQSGSPDNTSDNQTDDIDTAPADQGGANDNSEYEVYTVQAGDTFGSISTKFYGTFNKYKIIMEYNNIQKENSLNVGQEIKIPKQK